MGSSLFILVMCVWINLYVPAHIRLICGLGKLMANIDYANNN